MSEVAIQARDVGKMYHLGSIGYGSLKADVQTFFAKLVGKEDPNAKLEAPHPSTYSEFWALRGVDFDLKQGDRLGIIGKNGSGKSTLLKILSRITTPTTGEIRMRGKVASLLEVGTGFQGELTARDNVFLNGAILGMKRREIQSKFDEIIDFSGCEKFVDTPVKRFSSGMYVRLAFSVAAFLETDIMIIDEVLAVGDAEFQAKSLAKMNHISKNLGRTVLFVSHNMEHVTGLCNQILYLKKGQVSQISSDVATLTAEYQVARD